MRNLSDDELDALWRQAKRDLGGSAPQ